MSLDSRTDHQGTHEARVLVVEDEANARSALVSLLTADGFEALGVESAEEALEAIESFPAEVFLIDVKLPGMSGLDLIPRIKARVPESLCIVTTAFSSVESAVEAMRRGAEDYLVKPLNPDELELKIERELRNRSVAIEAKRLREQITAREGIPGMVGASVEMKEVYRLISRAAPSRASVLITGESGTGKELIARALHSLSPRTNGPFIAVNCAALPDTLLESELFGHEKGSFTGAIGRKAGRFELADGGTLFLDEIGEMPPQTQVKLLRVLQERTFERVGGTQTISVNVRVIAATNRDLEVMVTEGRYRDDLYYRLNVVTIHAPALRERRADIPILWEHFIRKYQELEGKENVSTDPEVLLCLFAYDWPGNVRELENVAEHAVVMGRGEHLTRENLPPRIGGGDPAKDPLAIRVPGMTMAEVERAAILRTFEAMDHSTRRTADALGISVRKIQYRLKEYRAEGFLAGVTSLD
ncbi:MAG: sigma-54 dependent transcriptional regulator [Deltaproteobacteria bacterium]|nr:sigma-54 dependent transcriptional regulator [Deltaproteobacteria bacterium]